MLHFMRMCNKAELHGTLTAVYSPGNPHTHAALACLLMAGRVQETETEQLSDQQLRESLQEFGFTPGPVTLSTRTTLERKLRRLSTGKASGAELAAVDCEIDDGHHGSRRRSTGTNQLQENACLISTDTVSDLINAPLKNNYRP
jgi:hypothetical protein